MRFLIINNVIKHYHDVEVLKQINISIDKGDFLVLVGPSGCGKSTLLNMIAGLEDITEGEIHLNNQKINGVHPSKRDIAMVFQSYALYPNMTVANNIRFGLEMRKVAKPEQEQAINQVAKLLQIDNLLDRKPAQLSGGQRQRVAMGRALVREPQLFLFDEPLSNLDAKLRVDMRTEIKLLHQRLGATIVYVTHDQIEAMTLASKIAVMNAGVVQQFGTPETIYENPANTFVASFMGSPAMNLLSGKVVCIGDQLSVAVNINSEQGKNTPLCLPVHRDQQAIANYLGKDITLGLRPETITDPESANRAEGIIHEAELQVKLTEPTGADMYVVTEMGGKEVVGRMRNRAQAKAKGVAPFAFDVSRMVAFDPASGVRIQ
ncbi:ABC transporter ATP-binding protein [Spartinivicinus poritis]|uniref:Sn-glycerol-3-phosphate ABC transporter ATP-binding protein UgpC n=1 Tax=Spartinivicinus poritis TaxID=2994640 RepID=A0ABT5UBX3_9GAMM|nr:sn-glycerol-3-phosphate ABC transporter ATP-binding protein UgpC [Spartinivicinus sp. A2-2]MDE1463486.1 sn-glycerol-3-phosphate ABC transporter ATP-binding protein UgpC [Spartinivicinus sp. A2-2]